MAKQEEWMGDARKKRRQWGRRRKKKQKWQRMWKSLMLGVRLRWLINTERYVPIPGDGKCMISTNYGVPSTDTYQNTRNGGNWRKECRCHVWLCLWVCVLTFFMRCEDVCVCVCVDCAVLSDLHPWSDDMDMDLLFETFWAELSGRFLLVFTCTVYAIRCLISFLWVVGGTR